MGLKKRCLISIAVGLICIGGSLAWSQGQSTKPQVTAPPDSFFEMVKNRPRGRRRSEPVDIRIYRDFYKKYLDIKGIPVVAAEVVADEALHRTYEIVTHMLAGRPDILQGMVDRKMYLVIIGKDQLYCDMPENRNAPNPDYLNERVRGTGGYPTSFGEENLLSLPIDRYDDESIGVHEFCHTIDSTLRRVEPEWKERRKAAYQNAVDKGLYKDTYAISNRAEYWAEIAQAYFNCNRVNNWNHGPIGKREQLKIYDPMGYELCRTTFNLSPEQDWRYTWLRPLPNVIQPPAKFNIHPYYTKFTWAREFTVIGRKAGDEAMLKANDTIRKLFAYRHDILKALMAEDLKLVVLGPDENLADLPQYPQMKAAGVDHMGRYLEYTPGVKILVASQENVLGDIANDPYGTESQVIRVFAKAIYDVTATRPVDPNWENRGRNVQQYELRVQRMDIRFDEKLKEIYESAMSKGLWKGTVAVHNRVEYWTEGLMAYFDAMGQGVPPNDAAHPITTREALREYDPDLFKLVDETMAYKGKVDWRYQ
ncbi:MAG: hypothetical protein PVH77_06125 [Phycisphaerales bacterium]